MSNDKIWAYSNTGNLAHAFVQKWTDKDGNESSEHLRAMCRKTIARHAFTRYEERKFMLLGLCANCVKLADARQARIQDADQPPTEAHDLGYVPTGDADSLDNEQRERLQAGFDAAVAAHQAAQAAVTPELVTIGKMAAETLADAETRLVQELRAEIQDPADPAPEFPAGLRVTIPGGAPGTVEPLRGRVTTPNHPNYGLPFVSVRVDARGHHLAHERRFFLDELTPVPSPMDAAHVEALEMDAAGEALTAAHVAALTLLELEAKPIRWHYRAHRQTSHGAFLGVLEGYVTQSADVPESEVERRIRVAFAPSTPGHRLANFFLRKA